MKGLFHQNKLEALFIVEYVDFKNIRDMLHRPTTFIELI